jgi:Lar family restriction alleviation protein
VSALHCGACCIQETRLLAMTEPSDDLREVAGADHDELRAVAGELLLPCPFCGWDKPTLEEAAMQDGEIVGPAYVRCVECGAVGPFADDDEPVAAWNRRAVGQHPGGCPCGAAEGIRFQVEKNRAAMGLSAQSTESRALLARPVDEPCSPTNPCKGHHFGEGARPHCKFGHPISDWLDSSCLTCSIVPSASSPTNERVELPAHFEEWALHRLIRRDSITWRETLMAWTGATDVARVVINPLIEFGAHLDYCMSRQRGSENCDCGRDEAVADAEKFMAEESGR